MYESVWCSDTVVFVELVEHGGRIFLRNSKIRYKVLVFWLQSLEQALNHDRLMCLGHVLHIHTKCLPCCAPFRSACNGWEVCQVD